MAHSYVCDVTRSHVCHDSCICLTWLIQTCDISPSYATWLVPMCAMTHLYILQDSFIYLTWLIQICVTRLICGCAQTHSYVCHDSFLCRTWPVHMRDITHSYATQLVRTCDPCVRHKYSNMWQNSWIRVTWHMDMCEMTHPCVTWLIDMCDMTHSYVWHASFICVTWLMYTCDTTHAYVWDNPLCAWTMGWLRSLGSIKS